MGRFTSKIYLNINKSLPKWFNNFLDNIFFIYFRLLNEHKEITLSGYCGIILMYFANNNYQVLNKLKKPKAIEFILDRNKKSFNIFNYQVYCKNNNLYKYKIKYKVLNIKQYKKLYVYHLTDEIKYNIIEIKGIKLKVISPDFYFGNNNLLRRNKDKIDKDIEYFSKIYPKSLTYKF